MKKSYEWIMLKIILNHERSKLIRGLNWLGIIADCSRQMFLSRCNKELNESSKQWFDGIFLVCLHWAWMNHYQSLCMFFSTLLRQIMVKKLGSWPNDKLFPVVDLWVQSSELSWRGWCDWYLLEAPGYPFCCFFLEGMASISIYIYI